MIPAALIGMLAVNRLGAIHSVVFGGFAPTALAQRIDACKPALILTASCSIPLIEEAISLSLHKPDRVLVWQREHLQWKFESWWRNILPWLAQWLLYGSEKQTVTVQSSWQELVAEAKARKIKADCVPVKSEEAVYIMHTSGTTGVPKGVRRDAGGHLVGLAFTMSYIFGIQGPGVGDVVFTTSDIGWVVGHSYILYGPLLTGATTVLYEGKPMGTPDAFVFWRIVEEYRVSVMFTAPTALRSIRIDDPSNDHFSRIGVCGGLRSLRALFLAGERSEPSLVSVYQELLEIYGAKDAQVVDNWWSTEIRSPITARALAAHEGLKVWNNSIRPGPALLPLKPGSPGKPVPGHQVRVVDDEGQDVQPGVLGHLVLGFPLAPTALRTLWEDDDRFYKSYFQRFGWRFFDTVDYGWMDGDGYVYVMSRSDDVLNVSAHRLSSGGIEQAILTHPLVAECCITGIPDDTKGELPFAFITLTIADDCRSEPKDAWIEEEIRRLVRTQVRAFASLGGMILGNGIIPKTRSGKMLRRVLRELFKNGVSGEYTREVSVPSTIEDGAVVEAARGKVEDYFKRSKGKHKSIKETLGL
ncbi:acetyl-CoA synthetase-like protein [Bimuria novae-zelandiae CBS 107.79]|uniref:Acetyl-CoA synthetase-like protein n=1 Tax=Bimuria novae-zelandiae CBS 107.79 TaxID=1447943 RepID=A0A6A5V2S6_9PLEO|nr:acetyl-CoA synthetase-like protein [Bimuria novae-zelandiae CBS 107.79]